MAKPKIFLLITIIILSANAASTTQHFSMDEQTFMEEIGKEEGHIDKDSGVTTINLPEYDEWDSIEFLTKVEEGPGNYIHLEDNVVDYLYIDVEHQPYLVLTTAHPFRNSYTRLPSTDYDLEEGWYRINLTKTGDWTGTLKVFEEETGEEIKNMEGERVEDSHIFSTYHNKPGSFKPSTLYLYQGTSGLKYKNVSFSYEEKHPGPAPENSLLMVENDFEKILAASTTKKEFLVGEPEKKEKLEGYEKIYALGNIGKEDQSYENIGIEDLPHIFFPETDKKVFAEGTRKDKMLSTRYALEKNLPITFKNRENSIKPEKEGIISDSGNHIVLADSSKNSSALAPLYSKKRNASLIINTSEETLNPVKKFRKELKTVFKEKAGEPCPESIANDIHVTNFAAPMKQIEDPVEAERNVFYTDEIDNQTIYTDRPYTDLLNDGYIDVNYGRIPENPVKAQKMMENQGVVESDSMIISSYMHETRPGIVANLGGGLTYGLNNMIELENQGMEVELLVENRTSYSDVGDSIRSLISAIKGMPDPVKMVEEGSKFLEYVKQGRFEKFFKDIVTDPKKTAKIIEKSLDIVEDDEETILGGDQKISEKIPLTDVVNAINKAKDGTKLLMTGLEYRPRVDQEKIDVFVESLEENRSYRVLEEKFLRAFLMQRPVISEKNLEQLSDQSKAIYIGEGNGTHWHIPDETSISGDEEVYSGLKNFQPIGFNGFMVDTSDIAGRPNSQLYKKSLKNGSSGFLGFTGRTYYHYTQELVQRFLRLGYYTGSAYRKSFNRYKKDSWTFDPDNAIFLNAYWRSKVRKNKTLDSYVHYGVPDTVKDPFEEVPAEPETTCGKGICEHTWQKNIDYVLEEKMLRFEDVETHKEPEMPEVYFKKFSRTIPPDSEIKNIELERDERELDITYVENVTENVFPVKNKQVDRKKYADGRKKVIIKVPVLRNFKGTTKVSENITLNLKVEKNTVFNLEAEKGKVEIMADTEKNQNGTLVLKTGNRTDYLLNEKNVSLEKGSNVFRIKEKNFEDYFAELYFIGETFHGPLKDRYSSREKEKTEINTEVGETFEVETPGNLDEKVKVVTPVEVQTDFLEPEKIDAGETAVLKALKPGKHFLKLESDSWVKEIALEVDDTGLMKTETVSTKNSFEERINKENFLVETSSNKKTLKLEHENGELIIETKPGSKNKTLRLKDKKIELKKKPEKTIKRFVSPGKIHEKIMENGEIKEKSRGVKENRLEKYVAKLERESKKLVERKDIRRSG